VIPVLNGEKWIEDCFLSIVNQNFSGNVEVSVFNDGSTVSINRDRDIIVQKINAVRD